MVARRGCGRLRTAPFYEALGSWSRFGSSDRTDAVVERGAIALHLYGIAEDAEGDRDAARRHLVAALERFGDAGASDRADAETYLAELAD